MSDTRTAEVPRDAATGQVATGRAPGRLVRFVPLALLLLVLLALPLYVGEFWLRTGFAVFGAVIGAVGLNLLVGTTGQLSLGHAFFLAVGAITYVYASGEAGGTATKVTGLGLPPGGRTRAHPTPVGAAQGGETAPPATHKRPTRGG